MKIAIRAASVKFLIQIILIREVEIGVAVAVTVVIGRVMVNIFQCNL